MLDCLKMFHGLIGYGILLLLPSHALGVNGTEKVNIEKMLETGIRVVDIMKETCKMYPDEDSCKPLAPMNETKAAAETFLFKDVREKEAAYADTWSNWAWRRAKTKAIRAKCQNNRVAIFVGGASGSGREVLSQVWKNLTDPDCGYVYLNYNQLVTGGGGFEAGKKQWEKAFNKYGKCAQFNYGSKGGVSKWVYEFIEKAIDKGCSFVYSDTMTRLGTMLEKWKSKIAKLKLPGKPHKVHLFASTSDVAEAITRNWNRAIGRRASGGDTQIGYFVALCFVFGTQIAFSKIFVEEHSNWENVQLFLITATEKGDDELKLVFKRVNGTKAELDEELYAKFKAIADLTPYEFEKAIENSPEGKKNSILQRHKELNRDCGYCSCDVYSFAASQKSSPPKNLTGDGDKSITNPRMFHAGFGTCFDKPIKNTDCLVRVISCATTEGLLKCPKLCGLCYDLTTAKCNVSIAIDQTGASTTGVLSSISNMLGKLQSTWSSYWTPEAPAIPELAFEPSTKNGTIYFSFFEASGGVHDTMQKLWKKMDKAGFDMWMEDKEITSKVTFDPGTAVAQLGAFDSVTNTAKAVGDSVMVVMGITKSYLTDYHKELELEYVLTLKKPFVIVLLEKFDKKGQKALLEQFGEKVKHFDVAGGQAAVEIVWDAFKDEVQNILNEMGLTATKAKA